MYIFNFWCEYSIARNAQKEFVIGQSSRSQATFASTSSVKSTQLRRSWIKLIAPLSTEYTRYARVSHSRQWCYYNIPPDPYLQVWVGWGIRLRPLVYRFTRFFTIFSIMLDVFLFIPLKILKMVALGYKRLPITWVTWPRPNRPNYNTPFDLLTSGQVRSGQARLYHQGGNAPHQGAQAVQPCQRGQISCKIEKFLPVVTATTA